MYKIFSIIGTTAAGKDYAANYVSEKFNIKRIPTITSRKLRKNEKGIKNLDKKEYEKLVKLGEFFEYTLFDGHYYGKLKGDIIKNTNKYHALYHITPDRVAKLKRHYPNCITICLEISNPIYENTFKRLKDRGHTDEWIKKRLKTLKNDIKYLQELDKCGHIDHKIITKEGDKEYTLNEVEKIIRKYLK